MGSGVPPRPADTDAFLAVLGPSPEADVDASGRAAHTVHRSHGRSTPFISSEDDALLLLGLGILDEDPLPGSLLVFKELLG